MASSEAGKNRIVVGIDGSGCSMQALDWALRQAELTGSSVLVVTAWHWPVAVGWGVAVAPPYIPAEDAEEIMEKALEPVRKRYPAAQIESMAVEGHPAKVLVDASREADLLVVGSRGHGEFAGMLLGSVSQHCASHATCPVVIFREKRP